MTFDFLASMTDVERRELHEKLSHDLAVSGAKERELTEAEHALWRAIGQIAASAAHQKLATHIERSGYRKYAEAVEAFEQVFASALPPVVRRPIKEAVRLRMLRCLADYLIIAGVPVSAATLLNNMPKLKYAVDRQFPGYIAAGLLHRIVQVAA